MKRALTSGIALMFLCILAGYAAASDPCIDCHEKNTPGIVNYWKNSRHFEKQVTCSGCHGNDVEANHKQKVIVDAAKCGACHKAVLKDHLLSKHAIGLKAGKGCTRNIETAAGTEKSCLFCHKPGSTEPIVKTECAMFLAQSPEMQRQGCSACHIVEVRCDTCHTKHGTDLALAREPDTCGVCHMGPDHPQVEMWEKSVHGVIYRNGAKDAAPSCVTCHMHKGSHNVSRGISTGLPHSADAVRKSEREEMISICSACHTPNLAKRNLDDADRIEEQASKLVEEAQGIIEGLQKDALLLPRTEQRPHHPLFGERFVIGPHMLYENLSSVESLFFRMKQFYAPTAFKGVFHQNPDYAHWYGNAPLKLTLSEIESEAALLRELDNVRKRIDNMNAAGPSGDADNDRTKKLLRDMKEKRLRGELSEQDYEKAKKRILEDRGL